MELGGNITLTGFSERDFTELIVVKKIVGQYARKLTDTVPGFNRLHVTLKEVHQHDTGGKVEIHSSIGIDGDSYASESIGHNLFIVLDESLKRSISQVQKDKDRVR